MQRRAQAYVEKRNQEFALKSKNLGLDEKLQAIEGLDKDMLMSLADHNIRTIDDLADLSTDELIEILGQDILSTKEAEKVIMAARAHWFEE